MLDICLLLEVDFCLWPLAWAEPFIQLVGRKFSQSALCKLSGESPARDDSSRGRVWESQHIKFVQMFGKLKNKSK